MRDFHFTTSSKLSAMRNDNAEANNNNGDGSGGKPLNIKHVIVVWFLGIVIAIFAMFIKPLVGICKDSQYDINPFLLEETWQINGILIFISATMTWSKKFGLQKLLFFGGIAVGILALIIYVILLCVDSVNEELIRYLNVIDFCILVAISIFEAVVYLVGQRFEKRKIEA